jgi:hypothetical protein
MPHTYYHHTQIETRYLLVLLASAVLYLLALFILILPIENDDLRLFGIAAISALLALEVVVFMGLSMLTVTVTEEAVSVHMLAGMMQVALPIGEIEDCQPVSGPGKIGLGVRVPPNSIVYRISDGDAVEITLSDRQIVIGSDEPEELILAIRAARRKQGKTGPLTPP